VKLGQTEETLIRLRDEGLAACSFMVNGFPNQTVDDMRRSIEWVCDLIARDLLQASYFFGLVPYPGSEMYHHPEKFGMKLHHHNFKFYHEEMPPVFDSPFAKSDEAYQVFLEGLKALAQAMSKRPYFGDRMLPTNLEKYGTFWSEPHV
jgi:hypothetical protein